MSLIEYQVRGFVTEFDDKKVTLLFCSKVIKCAKPGVSTSIVHTMDSYREADRYPLFEDMELYRGANITLDFKLNPDTMDIFCNMSKARKWKQLFNYYILGKF